MASRKRTFDHINKRHFTACLLALVTATTMIPGMTVYLPFSITDKIGLPIFLFPFLWAGLFIYSYVAKNVWHPLLIIMLLFCTHATLSVLALQ